MADLTRSDTLAELAAALSAAQAEFAGIPKDSTNPFFKSKYASLPTVIKVAAPVLTKHGLSVCQFPGTDERGDTLTTWLLHSSGEFISQSMRLYLPKSDAQGQGSALTYARRYAYMAALGLVADEDDDGAAASRPEPPRQPKVMPATAADVESLKAAAKGLTAVQIRGAFGAAGLPAPVTIDGALFSSVPQDKALRLTQALSGVKR